MKQAVKIIGLTGNIATGKSVIRRMLENAGALGLDADLIAHRTQYPGGPTYQSILESFGDQILTHDGSISRSKLAKIVFEDPDKLAQLEALVHPAVEASIRSRIKVSAYLIVVIEAIKLLEAGLDSLCDIIWVSHASQKTQVDRLMNDRNLTEDQALTRINAQPPQSEKLKRAQIVINTEGSFRATWRQTQDALNDTIKLRPHPGSMHIDMPIDAHKPLDIESLQAFWKTNLSGRRQNLYENLGMSMVLPILDNNQVRVVAIWENWNFTAALQDWRTPKSDGFSNVEILSPLVKHARLQQAELLMLPDSFAEGLYPSPVAWGFEKIRSTEMAYPAWAEAAFRVCGETLTPIWTKVLAQPFEGEREIH
jgi:dephospho-CoA kinase